MSTTISGAMPSMSAPAAPSAYGYATTAARAEKLLSEATPGIPALNASGLLPAGIHDATLGELTTRFATTPERRTLLGVLERELPGLQHAGISDLIIGGSFVTGKRAPGDIDAAFVIGRGAPARAARNAALDAIEHATLPPAVPGLRPVHQLGLFEHDLVVRNAAQLGRPAGVNFLEFFGATRTGEARGMVRLHLGEETIAAAERGVAELASHAAGAQRSAGAVIDAVTAAAHLVR